MNSQHIYDIVGIGVGPFNLGLACLTQPLNELSTIFFDSKDEFDWHSGIMPEGSTLQIPFIADLVSFADPKNNYSFLNYLKLHNRLYQFFIRESFFILRAEYNLYCKWAAEQLENVHFKSFVERIDYDESRQLYTVRVKQPQGEMKVVTKNLVLGTGTTPITPKFCQGYPEQIQSSADYLRHKKDYLTKKSITIVGGGQSGAEIYYDLLSEIDQHGYQLNWLTKAPHFFSMDLGKLTLEYTSPDYTSHFYSLDEDKRDQVIGSQNALYKGIELSFVNRIYDLLYQKSLHQPIPTRMMPNCALDAVEQQSNHLNLTFKNSDINKRFKLESEVLILALGYEYKIPECLTPIRTLINWDSKGRIALNWNYSINDDNTIFAQNIGIYSHGFTVPDLGMGCYRNAIIINTILGREVYPVEKRIAYQEFAPTTEEIVTPVKTTAKSHSTELSF
ncbi:lysine N(6)-hydroxylase/L-ornithine N(5)-oxygenase family protein [Acinetobacter baumannii]|jgi:Lysine/ornithine N-monooxygenase|uniref:Putrescine N-hydroxylase n=6 Tax=Acinetobacter baumannii TaxID=470 RepID=PUTNH_ACIBT|nr:MULTISPECIES: SidA/IucD/PvdA family monooxygenase [Acinetobacter]ABO12989.2 putative siderophore biosynthesis protein [Acinetobacter baumannii ATCC 17978]AKQ26045.1 alcaligin biosynthesis protein [Acinetobacter baumannii]ALJ86090.1 Siderophore biosynthesis protein, monooxygenase [Acinetobacter baumannii]APP29614.1 alcaligin biosynthesis protein [Acinetobacter baumannii]APX48082.1 alcaligin biosynthesis protein [Acinetobacter baumannii]